MDPLSCSARKPPDCHHAARTAHPCHFGPCPPCKQTCEKVQQCGHACEAPCHTSVKKKKSSPRKFGYNRLEGQLVCDSLDFAGAGQDCSTHPAKSRPLGARHRATDGGERVAVPSMSGKVVLVAVFTGTLLTPSVSVSGTYAGHVPGGTRNC